METLIVMLWMCVPRVGLWVTRVNKTLSAGTAPTNYIFLPGNYVANEKLHLFSVKIGLGLLKTKIGLHTTTTTQNTHHQKLLGINISAVTDTIVTKL